MSFYPSCFIIYFSKLSSIDPSSEHHESVNLAAQWFIQHGSIMFPWLVFDSRPDIYGQFWLLPQSENIQLSKPVYLICCLMLYVSVCPRIGQCLIHCPLSCVLWILGVQAHVVTRHYISTLCSKMVTAPCMVTAYATPDLSTGMSRCEFLFMIWLQEDVHTYNKRFKEVPQNFSHQSSKSFVIDYVAFLCSSFEMIVDDKVRQMHFR